MTAYVIFQSTVKDAAKLSAYAAQALPIVAAHGGRRLSAGDVTILYASTAFDRGTLFEFEDGAAARAWHDSVEYQRLLTLRSEAMGCSIVMIDEDAR